MRRLEIGFLIYLFKNSLDKFYDPKLIRNSTAIFDVLLVNQASRASRYGLGHCVTFVWLYLLFID